MELPRTVQEIAAVIGRERALFLIGQLPNYKVKDKRGHIKETRVILYVPKNLTPNHELVRILGYRDASKMARMFGGELLYPGNCMFIHRLFVIDTIRRLNGEGMPHKAIAEMLDISERTVKRHCADNPHKEPKHDNDNNPPALKKTA